MRLFVLPGAFICAASCLLISTIYFAVISVAERAENATLDSVIALSYAIKQTLEDEPASLSSPELREHISETISAILLSHPGSGAIASLGATKIVRMDLIPQSKRQDLLILPQKRPENSGDISITKTKTYISVNRFFDDFQLTVFYPKSEKEFLIDHILEVKKEYILFYLLFSIIIFAFLFQTTRRQINSVERNERALRGYAEASSDFFWEMDENLRFSKFSSRFYETTGVKPEFLLGKTREEAGNPGVSEKIWHEHLKALSHRKPFRDFFHPRTKPDGSIVWLSINGVPSFSKSGRFEGYLGIGRDVTQAVNASDELKTTRDKALSAEKAKSQFLATMSHEIRTPMNGIIGMSELLNDTDLNEEQSIFAKSISSSAQSLLHILNDILDIAKFDASEFKLDSIPFSFSEVIEKAIEPIAFHADQKGIALGVLIEPGAEDRFLGDPSRIRQVLVNLLGNAIKFTDEGSVTVGVSSKRLSNDRILLTVNITDTGIGISETDQERLFDEFTQVDSSISRKHSGTGLGLSISKKLVELMGGKIAVKSQLGQGTTFTVSMPLGVAERRAIDRAAEMLRDKRALVVDDDPVNLTVLSKMLQGFGMHFDVASSAEDGITKFKQHEFDFIFTDHAMPVEDGVRYAERVRQDGTGADVKIILISSLSTFGEDLSRNSSLFDARLMKPITRSSLLAGIKKAMEVNHDGQRNETGTATKGERPHQHNGRVLVAEDNKTNQQVIGEMLSNMGLDVDIVDDGVEAVEASKSKSYDIIFMDMHMPGLNGRQATSSIKSNKCPNQSTPVVAVTADVMMNVDKSDPGCLFEDVLHKPFTSAGLRSVVHNLIRDQ